MERVRCDVDCATRGETAWGVRGMRGDATTLGDASRGDANPICRGVERLVCFGVETCHRSEGCVESANLMLPLRGTEFVCVVAMRDEVGLCATFLRGVVVLHPSELLLQEPDADEGQHEQCKDAVEEGAVWRG